MFIVTGGAGFIGSNLVYGLNERGYNNIIVVDNLTNGDKAKNLAGLDIVDYYDKHDFMNKIYAGDCDRWSIKAIFHQGACSDTMEYNGKYMMDNNFEYSKQLFGFCQRRGIPFIYASSASVYGSGQHGFSERNECERPLNVYAYSKLLFDRYVEKKWMTGNSQVVGLRYFNVYGPQENAKGKMASVAYQLYRQLQEGDIIKLFSGCDGYGNGEQLRDFIYVKDVVSVILHFYENNKYSGIYNCGTGRANSFNLVAKAVIEAVGRGEIEYIPFPDVLQGKYQSFTEADSAKLTTAGFPQERFSSISQAIAEYMDVLKTSNGYLRSRSY